MKIKLFFGVWIAILSVVSAARASLKEVVDIAYENRHEVEISKKQVDLTRWRQINAARRLGPSLVLEYKKSEGETLDDPYRAQSYGLRFEQSLFQGGRKYYTYKREQTARKVAEYSQERVKQEIMQEAADNYYRVKMNNSIVGTYERALPQIQSEYEIASNKYSSEALTELDFEEISNIREIIDVRKNMAEDDLLIAKMELKSALGLDEIPDMDYGEFKDIPEKKDLEYSRSECIDIALQNRPEMRIARLIEKQSDYEKKIARGDNIPALLVEGFAGRSGQAYADADLSLSDQWSVFLNLRWTFWGSTLSNRYGETRERAPIFQDTTKTESTEQVLQFSLLDGLESIYRQREKEILKLQSQRDLKETRDKVIKEVESNYRQLTRAYDLLRLSKNRLKVSKRRNEVINKRRLLAQVTLKELLEARRNTIDIEKSLYESFYRFYATAAALNRSCGKEIIPLFSGEQE